MIKIEELIKRPIIRYDHSEEFLNKMTDEEIKDYYHEVEEILLKEGNIKKFPDWNVAFLAKFIDRSIFYNLFKIKK